MALMEGLDMGSDHDVFFEGTWRIPGLYLHDWPDRYIHTNYDNAANIDPTKLKRAAFIGAVSAWFLANMADDDVPAVLEMLERNALKRTAVLLEHRSDMDPFDQIAVTNIQFDVERRKVHSVEPFAMLGEGDYEAAVEYLAGLADLVALPQIATLVAIERNETVYERNPEIQGPMNAFGYSFLDDKYGVENVSSLKLLSHAGNGGQYAYEALNFVDGKRSVSDIRDWLTAELGPVPLEYVDNYLRALESIEVVRSRQ